MILTFFCFFCYFFEPELPIHSTIKLDIPEPSDIYFSANGQSLYIVSDKGRLYETNIRGEILNRSSYRGADFEAVCQVKDRIYVADETLRMILEFDEKLKLKKSRQYTYQGAMNRGWESLFYVPDKEKFYAFTEKLPVLLFEFDHDLDLKGVHRIEAISEVSGATYYSGYIWVVSDEDRTVYKLDPDNFKVKKTWKIPVLNPEGIAFDSQGTLWIVSDEMHSLYSFKLSMQ